MPVSIPAGLIPRGRKTGKGFQLRGKYEGSRAESIPVIRIRRINQ